MTIEELLEAAKGLKKLLVTEDLHTIVYVEYASALLAVQDSIIHRLLQKQEADTGVSYDHLKDN